MDAPEQNEVRYRFGEFELLPEQGELRRAGVAVRLQPQPLKVLAVLVDRAGSLVRRADLVAEVWGDATHVDFDRGLNYCIRQIRTALDDDAADPRFVRTVPRFGYRFVAEVRRDVDRGTGARVARRDSVRRAATAVGTALALLVLTLGVAWWLEPAGSTPSATDPRAMQEYLRGRYQLARGTPAGASAGLERFELAVAIAPDFARGHLGLAQAWARAPGDPLENAARSRTAVLRALALDDRLADAHAHLAMLRHYGDWDWAGADAAYRRAVELEPGSARLRHAYATFLSTMGRHDEAIAHVDAAMRLDPVSTAIRADAGWFHYLARRFDDATRLCSVTLELDPDNHNALWCVLQVQRQSGLDEAAVATARRLAVVLAAEAAPSVQDLDGFWRWYLDELVQGRQPATPSAIGLAYLAIGDRARALATFEQAYESHSSCVLALAADPQLDSLRGDPRFDELIARLDLER